MPPARRRSPRAAPVLPQAGRTAVRQRPDLAPFVVLFAVLVAAEDLYVGWLLWEPDPGLYWYVLVAAALAAWALTGAALVWQGRARGWVVLALASSVPLAFLLLLLLRSGSLGGTSQVVWWTLAMLVGPVGCLALATHRTVREWTALRRAKLPPVRARRSGRAG
ncbi:hypothetical protein [Blastococcus sp. TF02A-26]|uniref:hypothetical protein n=1 Tax=Blastococcus sp. TF02A-26 TaxID=2250577 RepID=UPI0011BE4288|nr:hypothetical protein [Blastococcus sp. TF02A-26]